MFHLTFWGKPSRTWPWFGLLVRLVRYAKAGFKSSCWVSLSHVSQMRHHASSRVGVGTPKPANHSTEIIQQFTKYGKQQQKNQTNFHGINLHMMSIHIISQTYHACTNMFTYLHQMKQTAIARLFPGKPCSFVSHLLLDSCWMFTLGPQGHKMYPLVN